jgi:G3E family GTPase
MQTADVMALSKTDLMDELGRKRSRGAVRAVRPTTVVVDAPHGQVPAALLFPEDPDHAPAMRDSRPRRPTSDRFETVSWPFDRLVSLPRLQSAFGRLAPKLARAKGLFEAAEQPGRQFVLHFAGGRATLAPAGTPAPGLPRARIVFVAEIGALSSAEVTVMMDECAHPGPD